MDPDATLRIMLEAFQKRDRGDAIIAMEELTKWLQGGGFMPTHPSQTAAEVFELNEYHNDEDC